MKKGLIISGCLLIGIIVLLSFISPFKDNFSIDEKHFDVENYVDISPRVNVINQEEYDFFYDMVSKEFEHRDEEEAIHEATLAFVQDVYAQFLISNNLQVSQPFSYQTLIYDMEQENLSRQLKQKNNEVFYGPVEYDLEQYFKYTLNNTKMDIVKRLSENVKEDLRLVAEDYFKEDPERFYTIISIGYEVKGKEEVEEGVLYNEEMSTLEKTNPTLFKKLYESEEGMEFEFEENGETVVGKVISKEINQPKFEEVEEEVIKEYITRNIYDRLVSAVGEENTIKAEIDSL